MLLAAAIVVLLLVAVAAVLVAHRRRARADAAAVDARRTEVAATAGGRVLDAAELAGRTWPDALRMEVVRPHECRFAVVDGDVLAESWSATWRRVGSAVDLSCTVHRVTVEAPDVGAAVAVAAVPPNRHAPTLLPQAFKGRVRPSGAGPALLGGDDAGVAAVEPLVSRLADGRLGLATGPGSVTLLHLEEPGAAELAGRVALARDVRAALAG